MKITALLSLVLLFCSAAPAQERYVRPVDDAPKDASFRAFRTRLIEAVKRKDTKFVIGVLDPKITNDFGGGTGIQNFKESWKPDDPKSALWKELLAVLTNGGILSKEGRRPVFTAPYTFTSFPDDLDAFTHRVIFGNNVNLRSRPGMDAPVVGRLSYNVVIVDYEKSVAAPGEDGEYEWFKVRTLGGLEGFVKSEYCRSPIDYRAIFQKINGRWRMVVFIAGD